MYIIKLLFYTETYYPQYIPWFKCFENGININGFSILKNGVENIIVLWGTFSNSTSELDYLHQHSCIKIFSGLSLNGECFLNYITKDLSFKCLRHSPTATPRCEYDMKKIIKKDLSHQITKHLFEVFL